MPDPVQVTLGTHKPDQATAGPFPGVRSGDVVAFEMQAPPSFEPWPGGTGLERKYLLLGYGVTLGIPGWSVHHRPDGSTFRVPETERTSWYVDLVTVEQEGKHYLVRDLFVDVMVAADGRHPRHLDLDELADALESGWISQALVVDGLRRWQRFLDAHLHDGRYPAGHHPDWPPAAIGDLADLPSPLAPPVAWPDV